MPREELRRCPYCDYFVTAEAWTLESHIKFKPQRDSVSWLRRTASNFMRISQVAVSRQAGALKGHLHGSPTTVEAEPPGTVGDGVVLEPRRSVYTDRAYVDELEAVRQDYECVCEADACSPPEVISIRCFECETCWAVIQSFRKETGLVR